MNYCAMSGALAPGSVVVNSHAAAGRLTVTGADEEGEPADDDV
jgi:hypothetical protein